MERGRAFQCVSERRPREANARVCLRAGVGRERVGECDEREVSGRDVEWWCKETDERE